MIFTTNWNNIFFVRRKDGRTSQAADSESFENDGSTLKSYYLQNAFANYIYIYIWLTISSCYGSIPLTLGLIGRDGGLSTVINLEYSIIMPTNLSCQKLSVKKNKTIHYFVLIMSTFPYFFLSLRKRKVKRAKITCTRGKCSPCLSKSGNLCCSELKSTTTFISQQTKRKLKIYHIVNCKS